MTAVRVTIRRAEPDNADAIADVHARSRQSAYRGLLPDEVIEQVVAGRQARADRFRAVIADPDSASHVRAPTLTVNSSHTSAHVLP